MDTRDPGDSSLAITAKDLAGMFATDQAFILIDVRQPEEHAESQIPGARLMPLDTCPEAFLELDQAQTYVLHCRLGGRSAKAQGMMLALGFQKVYNLTGGIEAWQALETSQG